MTNSMWVTLCMLVKAVSPNLFLWPIVCEWHCTSCEMQSHHIFSYDKQHVSEITHFVKGSLITSFPNRVLVTLHTLWKAASSHFSLWPPASEWDCTFCERQFHHNLFMPNSKWVIHLWKSHHIFPYGEQDVSNIAHPVKGNLILWPTASSSEPHCTFCAR